MPKIVEGKNKKVTVNTRIPEYLVDEIALICEQTGHKRSEVVRRLLEEALLITDIDWNE